MAEQEELDPTDQQELRETVSAISEEQIVSSLEDLARRELDLANHPSIAGDRDLRRASLWNAAALIAAAERILVRPREEPEQNEGGAPPPS
jgi:hypothetical protein